MTDDSMPDPAVTQAEAMSDWTDSTPAPASAPEWMGGPPPSWPAKAVRRPANIVVTVVLLVVGIGLLVYGVPAVVLHVRAAMGDGFPSEGNFLRALLAFVGFFVTFVGIAGLSTLIRNRRS